MSKETHKDSTRKIEKIASRHLGKSNQYIDIYDLSLLVKIPRSYNRDLYNISNDNLPFTGYDVWNAYEVSFLTNKNLPVSGVLKIKILANTIYMVESKSLKLYLNSFNMTSLGENTQKSIEIFEDVVSKDLSGLLESKVECAFYREEQDCTNFAIDYLELGKLIDLDSICFSPNKNHTFDLKYIDQLAENEVVKFQTDLLRSNCRVTNQPDWGNVYIYMETTLRPDYKSIARFIVSHRKINHFHEEVSEMLYMKLMEVYKPARLMVICLYTRRGGIDINPVRSSDSSLIPESFTNIKKFNKRTIRQ
jgi:7-cyano-7-deazaguanine reductase